jgi:hypothetical protein
MRRKVDGNRLALGRAAVRPGGPPDKNTRGQNQTQDRLPHVSPCRTDSSGEVCQKKKAAPEGAAKFREETPRKGRRHNKREVGHAALQQYGLLTPSLQVQNFGISSQKSSISAPFRLISQQLRTLLHCEKRIPTAAEQP